MNYYLPRTGGKIAALSVSYFDHDHGERRLTVNLAGVEDPEVEDALTVVYGEDGNAFTVIHHEGREPGEEEPHADAAAHEVAETEFDRLFGATPEAELATDSGEEGGRP